MKLIQFTSILFCIALSVKTAKAQTNFEEGYYINDDGKKTTCLIKNEDWKANPVSFDYKLPEDEKVKTGTLQNVQAFGVLENFKFVKHEVLIGKNLKDLQPSKDNADLKFENQTLFLKVLVEGKVDLYHYENGSLNIYFVKNPESNSVEQLVFKTYADQDNKIKYNNKFRTQLYKIFASENIENNKIRNIDYNKEDLVAIIKLYNGDDGSDGNITYYKKTKLDFNLYAKAGVGFASLEAVGPALDQNIDYENQVNLRFGIDFEIILPFENNKWTVFLSPTYQSYKDTGVWKIGEGLPSESIVESTVDYKSLELPVGVRHYLYFNEDSRLYFSGALVFDFNFNSTLKSTRTQFLDLQSGANYMFGLGYQYKKFGAEILYFTKRNLLDRNEWDTNYSVTAFQLSYQIF